MENGDPVFIRAEYLFHQLTDGTVTNNEQWRRLSSELHWIMENLRVMDKGSRLITKTICDALWIANGYIPPDDKYLDLLAVSMSQQEFATIYSMGKKSKNCLDDLAQHYQVSEQQAKQMRELLEPILPISWNEAMWLRTLYEELLKIDQTKRQTVLTMVAPVCNLYSDGDEKLKAMTAIFNIPDELRKDVIGVFMFYQGDEHKEIKASHFAEIGSYPIERLKAWLKTGLEQKSRIVMEKLESLSTQLVEQGELTESTAADINKVVGPFLPDSWKDDWRLKALYREAIDTHVDELTAAFKAVMPILDYCTSGDQQLKVLE